MAIVWGIRSALGFGAADFFARSGSQAVGAVRTLYYMQWIGLTALIACVIVSGERLPTQATVWQWAGAIGTAFIGMLSALAIYRAFEIGVLSIVSPIAASYGVITLVLGLLGGDELTAIALGGALAVIVGVTLAAISPTPPGSTAPNPRGGIVMALIASVGFGVSFWMLGRFSTPVFGGIMPVVLARLVTIIVLTTLALVSRRPMARPPRTVWAAIAAVGLLDTFAFVATTTGMNTAGAQVSIVSALSSMFSAVTVILAWLVLREPLRRIQWIGVGLILIGVAAIST